ncbi:ComF family protein [Nautilia sp. PV-1]|uniref:ComF family protein n=1 Tax=Nautilia sp. PV-1 TaxID=2579250 RepID=UPI001FEF3342|nr:phosphoribosyltransferase family protein [Nautilia sp. PV-1]
MAQNSLKYLAGEIKESFYVIPVDDKTKKGFSHTAVLAHEMKTEFIKPLYRSLLSSSNVQYAGKSLEFRLKNPRNFIYKGKSGIDVILIDDIATTGLTLNEAKECLLENGVNVVLSAVLANLKK